MKGAILASRHGTQLHTLTRSVSEQLLSVHHKPLIYYPLSVLMLAAIRDIQIISDPDDVDGLRRLLGDGCELGLTPSYAEQGEPQGLPDTFGFGADLLASEAVALILGGTFFHGPGFSDVLWSAVQSLDGCVSFGFVQLLDHRQDVRIACIEDVTLQTEFIDEDTCYRLGEKLGKSRYSKYVMDIATPHPPVLHARTDGGPNRCWFS